MKIISRTVLALALIVTIGIACTGCQRKVQQPTRDQLLARIVSADNYGVEFLRGEIGKMRADIGILTTSTGYLTSLTTSQLAGSIAARFETLVNIGITMKPLNEKGPMFDAVDSKEVLAARLMTDVCLACTQGPVASVEAIAERVSKQGTLTAQDSAHMQAVARDLGKASDLIVQYWQKADPSDASARTTIAEQVAELCTQLMNQ
jgi:hypothetical protein